MKAKSLLLTLFLGCAAQMFAQQDITAYSAKDNPRTAQMDLTAKEMAYYMAPGWNLGNTMEAGNNANIDKNVGIDTETSWQSAKTTQEVLNTVKKQGFNSVRIPCGWVMGHITDAANTTIDPKWMARVKQIIDYCLEANLVVVINDHWDGGWIEHDGFTDKVDVAAMKKKLTTLWTNIANALKDYDERVIFAGFNEPGVGGASPASVGSMLSEAKLAQRLVEYEQVFIDAVRATGGNNAKRILVVQATETNIDKACNGNWKVSELKDPTPDRLMVEVHFYDPWQFCAMSKDESWGKMQFYWNGGNCNYTSSVHKGTYTDSSITGQMSKMKTNFVNKGYPVIIGEYAADWRDLSGMSGESQSKHNESITYWYNLVTQSAMQYGLIPMHWNTNQKANSTIKRNDCSVYNQYILNGIQKGLKSGRTPFSNIYPKPSVTSGIESIEAPVTTLDQNAPIYNVAGQRVNANAKGLLIQAGKKIFK